MEIDWDKDGTVEASETMSIGFVPIWTRPRNTTSTSVDMGFYSDKPATQFMGVSDTYADRFVASLIGREDWGTDENVAEYFKGYVQEYKTQNGETLDVPTKNYELYPYDLSTPDYVHYDQFAYNEMGIDIARNVYAMQVTGFNADDVSVKLFKPNGVTEIGDTINMSYGDKLNLVPVVTPVSVNNLSFETSEGLSIEYPMVLVPTDGGNQTLTIKYQDKVLKEVTVVVPETITASDTIHGV